MYPSEDKPFTLLFKKSSQNNYKIHVAVFTKYPSVNIYLDDSDNQEIIALTRLSGIPATEPSWKYTTTNFSITNHLILKNKFQIGSGVIGSYHRLELAGNVDYFEVNSFPLTHENYPFVRLRNYSFVFSDLLSAEIHSKLSGYKIQSWNVQVSQDQSRLIEYNLESSSSNQEDFFDVQHYNDSNKFNGYFEAEFRINNNAFGKGKIKHKNSSGSNDK